MRWLAIALPYLALEWQQDTSGPKALLDQSAKRVVLANPEAQARGIKSGVALATALALCPDLQTQRAEAAELERALNSLALELGRWSARISCVDPGTLLAEVASMRRYFNGLERLIDAIQDRLAEQNLTHQLGFAPNPRAAWALAQANFAPQFDEARIDQQLDKLPVDTLQIHQKDLKALRALGIDTLGQLDKLPRNELGSRFTPELLHQLDQIKSRRDWVPPLFIPPESFVEQIDLQAEISFAQGLLFPLQRLLGRLEGFLQLRQAHALALEISLHHRDQGTTELSVRHAGGCYLAQDWLALLRLKLERFRLTRPVVELTLSVVEMRPWDAPPQDLFQAVKSDESPEQLLSRIATRLNRQAIHPLMVPATHLPQLSVAGAQIDQRLDHLPQAARPLWLLEVPQALEQQRVQRFSFISGPERIHTGWWHKTAFRDYFNARGEDGRLAWIFRDQHQRWFLHGWFS